ncbi:MAG TPA: ABC transporter permease [Conexibacter sp.]|nr:ABC transporter permease [Conexibacter sp.]
MISLERRIDVTNRHAFIAPIASIVAAIVIITIVLLATGLDPVSTYRQIVNVSVGDPSSISATLLNATPLLFTGLAAAVAFRMKAWNIGGEGQLYVGAIAAAAIGLLIGGSAPTLVTLLAMVAGGALVGGLWALLPAFLRVRFQTNEIITTLMLNYLGGLLLYYLIFDSHSYWRDTSSAGAVYPQGKTLDLAANWPTLTLGQIAIPFGLLLGVILAAALTVTLRMTKFGFRMRVIADSPVAGRYAGIGTGRMFLAVMVISGALAGLAGASQVGDFAHTLDPKALQAPTYGYTGIVVGALARYSPGGVVLMSLLLGALVHAGFELQGPHFPLGLVGTTEGVLLFCVIGAEFLHRYRVRVRLPRSPLAAEERDRAAVSAAAPAPARSASRYSVVRPEESEA